MYAKYRYNFELFLKDVGDSKTPEISSISGTGLLIKPYNMLPKF